MAVSERTVPQFSLSLMAKVHPLAIFNICDCYVRRLTKPSASLARSSARSSPLAQWTSETLTLFLIARTRSRVGSVFPSLSIACYDVYDNRIPFANTLEVLAKVQTNGAVLFYVEKFRKELSTCNMTLTVKGMLIESNKLDKLRPRYEATLVVCTEDGLFSVSVPCQVNPGPLQIVKALPPILENQVLPGCSIQEFILEVFDGYGNHVTEGTEVEFIYSIYEWPCRFWIASGAICYRDRNAPKDHNLEEHSSLSFPA